MPRYIDIETEGFHPLRAEKDDNYWIKVIEAVENEEDWMTTEEIDAALDFLFDCIAEKTQTAYGVTTLQ